MQVRTELLLVESLMMAEQANCFKLIWRRSHSFERTEIVQQVSAGALRELHAACRTQCTQ